MTSLLSSACDLSDLDLWAEVERAAKCERLATARLIALLMEVDSRKLYAGQGSSSLFTYCVHRLHLSEHAAYLRIEAARSARRFPVVLDMLSDGSLHLTAVSLLAPHLTPTNHLEVLDSARHKSKRDVEQLVARLRPQPDVPFGRSQTAGIKAAGGSGFQVAGSGFIAAGGHSRHVTCQETGRTEFAARYCRADGCTAA
jgi:hypothetical protein